MEANYDATEQERDWVKIKSRTRFLVVAAIAVGIVLASPSFAYCPKPSEMFVARTPSAAKNWAKLQLVKYGWNTQTEWSALEQLWTNESNWRCDALNKTPVYMIVNGKRVKFNAGGIPQRLGLNPKTNVKQQIKVGLDYVKARYGSPTKAWRFWQVKGWY
jgi:hypothetical protein